MKIIEPGDFLLFSFPIATSNSMAFGSGTVGYAVCISVCLNIINPMHIQQMKEMFPLPCRNTVEFCK
jgi:hypothetical protein